ncbi:MAG: ferritin-like domain-containing protein, partial [Polyangiaceae bacterium]
MAFLEAVSVHAFDRLEHELHAHGAQADLLLDARRARRDEERHTAMMTKLAARHGTYAQMPAAPKPTPIRSLVEIALENAVEGCVRETYGALRGLIESETATDV